MNFLVDPRNVINYQRSDHDLELWFLFSLVVAGKTASTQAQALERFLLSLEGDGPFDRIGRADQNGILLDAIKTSRLGQHTRLHEAFRTGLSLDLRNCTVDDLEGIRGIGPKTARMFLMMSRENQRHAALDTHILKFLATKGHVVPKATPTGKLYRQLEEKFLAHADESGMSVAEFDLTVWKSYAR